MKRASQCKASGGWESLTGAGGDLEKKCPLLWEFLTHEKWDDGSDRVPGTVMLLVDDGWLKAWLHDKDGAGRSCWVSAPSFQSLLGAITKALEGDGGDWRKDKAAGGKKK